MIDALIQFYFDTPLLIICLSDIKTLICHGENEINRVYFLDGFAQNVLQDFQKEKLKCFLASKKTTGKEENAGYQHFLLFPLCFQKVSCTGC